MGDALLERLRAELGVIELVEVGREALPEPTEVGRDAEARQNADTVIALRLDRHSTGESMLKYFAGLNYQRERLARGLVRTLLVMTHSQGGSFGPGADDLWDWTLRFRFGATVTPRPRVSETSGGRDIDDAKVTALELASAADQLRRARSTGLDEAAIARDYALPYLELLIAAGHITDAERIWVRELRGGEACDGMGPSQRFRCHSAAFDLALSAGQLSEAGHWSQLLMSSPTNEESSTERSIALNRRGEYLSLTGDLDAARTHFERALQVSQALAIADPSNTTWQRDLSVSCNNVGNLARDMGDLDVARTHFERALQVSQALALADPSNTTWQRDLSISHDNVGKLARDTRDLDAARTHFEHALQVRQALALADPSNTTWQRDLSASLWNVGRVEDWPEALTLFVQAGQEGLAAARNAPQGRRNVAILSTIAREIASCIHQAEERASDQAENLLRELVQWLQTHHGPETVPEELRPWLD